MEDIPASAVINSFEVLSDRISTAEEEIAALRRDVSTLLDRKVRKELITAYGPFDNVLLDIPCQLVRIPGLHNWDKPHPRTERVARPEVTSVVTSVVIRFDHNDIWEGEIRRRVVPQRSHPSSCFAAWEEENGSIERHRSSSSPRNRVTVCSC